MNGAHEVVVYQPDKGVAFGQALKKRNVRPAFDSLQEFLTRCTIPVTSDNPQLRAYSPGEFDDAEVIDPVVAGVISEFGVPDREDIIGRMWPSGEPLQGTRLEWELQPSSTMRVVEFLIAGEPWPKATLGPVELHLNYRFQWRDFATGQPLAGQMSGHLTSDGQLISHAHASFGRRQFIQPDLWFPFPEGSPALTAYLQQLKEFLPFKLNERHFRVASPTIKRDAYNYRKLVLPPSVV